MEDVVNFMVVWSILWQWDIPILLPFGIFCGDLVYFVIIWYIVPRKIWQPCSDVVKEIFSFL
jgi:hydrogenase-4 membrane subunit HyfE